MRHIMTTDEIRQTPGDVLVPVSASELGVTHWVKIVKSDLLTQLKRHATRLVVVETDESYRQGSWRYEIRFHGAYISRSRAEQAIKEDSNEEA